jgi:hypothetical protein
LPRNPGGQSSSAKRHDANGPTTPQDGGPGADRPSTLANETLEARDEITQSAKDAREILAKNEAQRNIIDDTDAPDPKEGAILALELGLGWRRVEVMRQNRSPT